MLAALLAKAGHLADARQILNSWNLVKGDTYESPILRAILYGWLGETHRWRWKQWGRPLRTDRPCACLPEPPPTSRHCTASAQFHRMLSDAGVPVP